MLYSIENNSISINGDVLAKDDLCYHVTAAVTSEEVQFFVFRFFLYYYQCWKIAAISSVLLIVPTPFEKE